MEPQQFLGLDVGTRRIGIARGGLPAKIAEPLLTLPSDKIFKELPGLIKEHSAAGIVVGLPRNLSGDDTAQTQWVRDWVRDAKTKIELPFYWQDEALTSKLAEAKQLGGDKKHDTDSLAAAIILQDFLDLAPAERVVC